ncbi:Flp pilus assembly protein CpaB [Thermanaerosceptrum fracticalcis]|uniref:Flp pilus assembly protein CpaB n=1 Tax=Thermanaerosceptrum fracticalcis TaxID=1712410 RepID=A0A7G6DZW7_THEFR|nr:Flp pilus assembly protein CpaB [Thermanaerosceptrum fracticalcis]QNB45371.1 Flp pilus assembly protein CpaB [Thermanaerosceptrum fracticalcis]
MPVKFSIDKEKRKGVVFILIALLCGVVAAGFVLGLAVKMSPKVPALEAVVEIAAGTPLDRSQFREIKLPEAGLPSEIIHPNTDLKGKIAARTMVPGDILRHLVTIDLEKGVSPSLLSARLRALNDPELRAVEIPVESVKNMLGGMKSGDRVDIVAVYVDETASGPVKKLISQTIMEAVPVLGLRSEDSGSASGGGQAGALIAAMKKEQVETYALYREKGRIYASLRPYNQ